MMLLKKHSLLLRNTHSLPLLPKQFSTTESKSKFWTEVDKYARLARVQRQIGTHLLLLPCYWGVALGTVPGALPSIPYLALFTVGALSARSAGCVINDFTDRDIDKHVERTKARPLTTGELSPLQAGAFLTGLMATSFGVLFCLPWEAIKIGLFITPVVFLYPTTKRYFRYPQLVLGSTFSVGVFIGYATVAATQSANWIACAPFYLGGILWTLVYDTVYAFQDREFDKKLGLYSAAIEFESSPRKYIAASAAASLACWLVGGFTAGLGSYYFYGLGLCALHYAY